MSRTVQLITLSLFVVCFIPQAFGGEVVKSKDIRDVQKLLKDTCPADVHARIEIGTSQVAALWQSDDGSVSDYQAFCKKYFIADPKILQKTLDRFEHQLESIDGHFHEISRDLADPIQLMMGDVLPVDYLFAELAPKAHIQEDLFKNKLAFIVLLNFSIYTLEDRLSKGDSWSRSEWAAARLAERFASRVPADVSQKVNQAYVKADDYIANYNIHMHHVLNKEGNRLFPEGLKLITHWNLRDELKAQYANADGLVRQQMIYEIMENIVLQSIPENVIDNSDVDWLLSKNEVFAYDKENPLKNKLSSKPEPDTRYQYLLDVFQAEKLADPYYPSMPTHMDRMFQQSREIPEAKVEALFHDVCSSEQVKKTAKLIEKKLGRPLQPFDIWYNGFKARGTFSESELDKVVNEKYPDVAAFDKDIPRILKALDFSPEMAEFLGSKIVVDPARGAGHAMGAERRDDNAHLRTRIPEEGMNYKGYNIAVHELGHCVEQVLSLNKVDHTLLNGVPNNGFTEAFAFVFQSRDLELLGLSAENPQKEAMQALDVLWSTYEIAGVSLVDMKVWHWMYDHPKATATELKNAVLKIAKKVWNQYYAPVFGMKDQIILGIYSHMIVYGLYLPDYPLGHIIMFQIEAYLKGKPLGPEMERMCVQGAITPDAWMRGVVGQPLSAQPLLNAAQKALSQIQ